MHAMVGVLAPGMCDYWDWKEWHKVIGHAQGVRHPVCMAARSIGGVS